MGLQELWFCFIALLFLGFLVLEGFDFGVGMLMEPLARLGSRDRVIHTDRVVESGARVAAPGDRVIYSGERELHSDTPELNRRAALNTIGPVWNGNEVWLIVAGAAIFAAFPAWYATVFSALYLPLLAILVGMIVRAVAIEWRGKIHDPKWRAWCDFGIAVGSWLPALLWGVAFAILVRGLPVDANGHAHPSITDVLNPYTLLGGLATLGLFLLYGAVFIALKTAGPIRDDAYRIAKSLSLPVTVILAAFGLWTQFAHGKPWTWIPLLVAVIAQLATVALIWTRRSDGLAFFFAALVVAAVTIFLFGVIYPNLVPSTLNDQWNITVHNASSTPYTLKIMTVVTAIMAPVTVIYQAWAYWVFRHRITAERIPAPVGLARRPS